VSRRVSVAFGNMVDTSWMAGGQYLYNLLYAVKACKLNLELVLRVHPGTPMESYSMLDGLIDRVVEFPHPSLRWVFKFPTRIRRQILRAISFEGYALKKERIDAQFMLMDPGNAGRVPSAVWIPDFQHLHFPEFFTKEDLEITSRTCKDAIQKAQIVVLSSNSALSDLQRIAPAATHKARVLSFVAQIKPEVYETDAAKAADHYHLPGKYFFLPNQLWQHKNHRTVIQALAKASEEFPEITVVCTGGTYDHRNPQYFDIILSEIATLGLQSNFRILGRIPRSYFYPLMRQSLAVLQPSFFEGWSTTVEETKSLGKTVILSDIPVHREQNPASAHYFNPHDPGELARIMKNLFRETAAGPDLDLEARSRAALPERTQIFATAFYQIMCDLVE
jgi:glycosyltransferase involved in cell wall biosynthesis